MAKQKLKGSEILEQFHTYVDDDTELSTAEEYILLNKKLNELANDRPWEWCKEVLSQAVSAGSTTYIELPEGFREFVEDESYGFGAYFVITFGDSQNKYPIYPFAKRFEYKDYAYYDPTAGDNGRIIMPKTFVSGTLTADIIVQPDAVTADTYPPFRGGYHAILAHMMATDFSIIERSEKARSYDAENRAAIANYLEDMAMEDAKQKEWNNEY